MCKIHVLTFVLFNAVYKEELVFVVVVTFLSKCATKHSTVIYYYLSFACPYIKLWLSVIMMNDCHFVS